MSETTDLSSQIQEATLFFQNHLENLKKIASYPGIDDVNLLFLVVPDEALINFRDFPSDFYSLVSEVGIRGVSYGELS